jgi:hypothetical protein
MDFLESVDRAFQVAGAPGTCRTADNFHVQVFRETTPIVSMVGRRQKQVKADPSGDWLAVCQPVLGHS